MEKNWIFRDFAILVSAISGYIILTRKELQQHPWKIIGAIALINSIQAGELYTSFTLCGNYEKKYGLFDSFMPVEFFSKLWELSTF